MKDIILFLGFVGIIILVTAASGCTNSSTNKSNSTYNSESSTPQLKLIAEGNFTGGTLGVKKIKIIPIPNGTQKIYIDYTGLDDGIHNLGIVSLNALSVLPTMDEVSTFNDPNYWVDAESLNLASNPNLPTSGRIVLNGTDGTWSAESLVIESTDTKWSYKVYITP